MTFSLPGIENKSGQKVGRGQKVILRTCKNLKKVQKNGIFRPLLKRLARFLPAFETQSGQRKPSVYAGSRRFCPLAHLFCHKVYKNVKVYYYRKFCK